VNKCVQVCENKIVSLQKNQGILLGVVGTDIPIQELMKTIPKHKVGCYHQQIAMHSKINFNLFNLKVG